jgi:hypothetical protein
MPFVHGVDLPAAFRNPACSRSGCDSQTNADYSRRRCFR